MIAIFLAGVSYKATVATDSAFIQTMFKMFGDELVFIDAYKTNRSIKLFGIPDDKILHYECDNVVGWKEHFEYAKNFLSENDIKTFIIFKPLMMRGLKHNDMGQYVRFKKKRLENNQYGFKYATMKHAYSKSLLIEAASKVCDKCIHFIVDPQEPNFDCVYNFNSYREVYFLSKSNTRRCVFMPCCEYGLGELTKEYDTSKKSLDFVFYCGALTDDRAYIRDAKDQLESIKNADVKVLESGKDFIKQEEYYKMIAKSKFTLCIKPYDTTSFSMLRWLESFYLGCIPLVHKDCCMDDVKETYPDIYDIWCKYGLFVTFDNIQNKISSFTDSQINDIIKEIKETKSFKKVNDLKYIKKRWKKIL